ncbi:MAG: flavodoxin family protein [Lachnospiraceae bacterium]|nr:flavodoxin family protein [Lachnospiraceae bacterium]
MKTLIFNGSPRPAGDTASLIGLLTEHLDGEFKVVDAYRCDISACLDCRYCWKNPGCAINDGMQDVYRYIEECDNVVIASPIYFSELTGKMLDVGSRLQTYFCGMFFRKEALNIKPKRGAVILVGGGDGRIEKPYETACTLMHHMNCRDIHKVVCSFNTNVVPAVQDEQAVDGVRRIAEFLNAAR